MNIAASLQPPLRAYDLLDARAPHYLMDIPDFTVSANLKSNQDAFSFLDKMHALDDETESVKKFKQQQS